MMTDKKNLSKYHMLYTLAINNLTLQMPYKKEKDRNASWSCMVAYNKGIWHCSQKDGQVTQYCWPISFSESNEERIGHNVCPSFSNTSDILSKMRKAKQETNKLTKESILCIWKTLWPQSSVPFTTYQCPNLTLLDNGLGYWDYRKHPFHSFHLFETSGLGFLIPACPYLSFFSSF